MAYYPLKVKDSGGNVHVVGDPRVQSITGLPNQGATTTTGTHTTWDLPDRTVGYYALYRELNAPVDATFVTNAQGTLTSSFISFIQGSVGATLEILLSQSGGANPITLTLVLNSVTSVSAGATSWDVNVTYVSPTTLDDLNTTVSSLSSYRINSITATTSNAGKFLQTNGSAASWASIPTDATRAPLASPALTGTPSAPTAAVNTNTTQLATTAFVIGQASAATPEALGTAAIGSSTRFARADHVHAAPTVASLGAVAATGGVLTSPVFIAAEERMNIVAAAATGTINFDILTASVWYYTTAASADFTLNLRGNSGSTLNSILAVGDSLTAVFLNTNGATARRPTVFQIDGSSVTPLWQGGTAPTSGNASSTDAYTLTVIKTAAAPTYVVLASQTQYK